MAISAAALQPAATRLQALSLTSVSLEGSADGFLTAGWTALTSLSFSLSCAAEDTMCSALELPALERMSNEGFRHRRRVLQLDQLKGSYPRLSRLGFSFAGVSEAGRQSCRFSDLSRLANLTITDWPAQATPDLDLPASLTKLTIVSERPVDFFWLLCEAEKCISRGAQLRSLGCSSPEALLQPARWGASLDEQFRWLGGRLHTLQQLWVAGDPDIPVLVAFSAVVSSAPHLTCAKLMVEEWLPRMELPPICSASLERLTVTVACRSSEEPPLVLAFLPGCKLLREVLVQFRKQAKRLPAEGTAVKIRCHSCSPTCIVPLDPHARAAAFRRAHGYEDCFTRVGVQLLPGPPSPQGVQDYTVLYTCHAAGPQQSLEWGHVVMPGRL